MTFETSENRIFSFLLKIQGFQFQNGMSSGPKGAFSKQPLNTEFYIQQLQRKGLLDNIGVLLLHDDCSSLRRQLDKSSH